jgi:hypothetical protein
MTCIEWIVLIPVGSASPFAFLKTTHSIPVHAGVLAVSEASPGAPRVCLLARLPGRPGLTSSRALIVVRIEGQYPSPGSAPHAMPSNSNEGHGLDVSFFHGHA